MEINNLADLNSLRTAPLVSNIQVNKLLEELEANIFNADWITIGIMAPSYIKAIEALKSISNKYSSIKFDIGFAISEGFKEPIDLISKKQQGLSSSKYISKWSSNLAITNLFDLFVREETNIEISSSNFFLSPIFAEVETLI